MTDTCCKTHDEPGKLDEWYESMFQSELVELSKSPATISAAELEWSDLKFETNHSKTLPPAADTDVMEEILKCERMFDKEAVTTAQVIKRLAVPLTPCGKSDQTSIKENHLSENIKSSSSKHASNRAQRKQQKKKRSPRNRSPKHSLSTKSSPKQSTSHRDPKVTGGKKQIKPEEPDIIFRVTMTGVALQQHNEIDEGEPKPRKQCGAGRNRRNSREKGDQSEIRPAKGKRTNAKSRFGNCSSESRDKDERANRRASISTDSHEQRKGCVGGNQEFQKKGSQGGRSTTYNTENLQSKYRSGAPSKTRGGRGGQRAAAGGKLSSGRDGHTSTNMQSGQAAGRNRGTRQGPKRPPLAPASTNEDIKLGKSKGQQSKRRQGLTTKST
jgi:hypothetical protein